ncbi:MAG: hypothetical protein GXO75_05075 [Calditrichaeota bacterium]|nr:hypothetical protein [Calditrichota bacterium]
MDKSIENEITVKANAQVNMGNWISRGWDMTFSDIGPIILISLIYLVVIAVASSTLIGEFVVIGPLNVGFFIIFFKKIRGGKIDIGDIGKGFSFFVAAALSYIIVGFFISIGFIFCIIPGIVISALYIFTPAIIAEKNLDFWQAMEASRKIVTSHLFEMSIFVIVLGFINLLGVLLCGIGVLISIPLTFAAMAAAYDDLVGIENEPAETAE